jgi:hypothetical protein
MWQGFAQKVLFPGWRAHIELEQLIATWLCAKSGISLCNLCVLCVSVVWFYSEFINHRDTENAEVAQRRARSRLSVQSLATLPVYG